MIPSVCVPRSCHICPSALNSLNALLAMAADMERAIISTNIQILIL
jgi:hypothetical protein